MNRNFHAYGGQRVKSDRFEPDEVGTTGDSSRNSRCPRGIVSNHEAVTPETIVDCAVDKTRFVSLELNMTFH